MNDEDKLTCAICGFADHYEAFDIFGCCFGNLVCPKCHSEIDSTTGKKAKHCGKCPTCIECGYDKPKKTTTQRTLFE